MDHLAGKSGQGNILPTDFETGVLAQACNITTVLALARLRAKLSAMNILVINTGSTSVKAGLFSTDGHTMVLRCQHNIHNNVDDPDIHFPAIVPEGIAVHCIVHRVVHGGEEHRMCCPIDDTVEAAIAAMCAFAPLHNPRALHWIRRCRQRWPVPQMAAFDTAYFSALPAVARTYALPRSLTSEHKIRRYGFHGLAHRAMWQRWCELRPSLPQGGKLITLQLGGGCSVAAIHNGIPCDTSMGFSPLEGLVMATRCGDIDAGVLIHLLRQQHCSADALEKILNEQSGLLGVSGTTGDMQSLLADTAPDAQLAIELFCYRARKYIGAFLAVMDGADGIVFGGGIGEHAPEVRKRILDNLSFGGIALETQANANAHGEACISGKDSKTGIWVQAVDENRLMAQLAMESLPG